MNISKKSAPVLARVLLGGAFVLFGANGFLQFLPPPEVTQAGGAFLGALAAAGYMFPLIKGTEIVAGLLLLSGRWVPLALIGLAPVLVNILAFHLFLSPTGIALPVLLTALEVYLAWSHRSAFRSVLASGAAPRLQTPAVDRVATTA